MKRLLLLIPVVAAGCWIGYRQWAGHQAAPQPHLPAAHPSSPRQAQSSSQPGQPVSDGPSAASAAAADVSTQAAATVIDQLLSKATSPGQRQQLLDQLRETGRLDDVIASLKQLAADNPTDAQIPLTLAETDIQKLRAVLLSQGDPNDVAVLGIQAEQSFQQALKLDPTNWEAQFDRAAALSHWPATLGKGPEVIAALSKLIDQQVAMAPQPEFAQTYLLLGQQYQAAGQADKAVDTYQRGAALYPTDSGLLKALSHGTAQ